MTTIDLYIALPLLIMAGGALLTLLVGAITRDESAGALVALATTIGAACWLMQPPPAPVAPNLGLAAGGAAQTFGIFFCLLAAGVIVLSRSYNRERGITGEEYPATVLFTTFGMLSLASATNLLTLFLGLEAMSFGFYLLVAIDLRRPASGEVGLKYLLPGALSAAFLAFGIALVYCAAGTLTVTDAARLTLTNGTPHPIALAGWGCILTGLAFKLSLVPVHLWTPDVYEGAPAPVTAFLSAGSKGAAILMALLLFPPADAAILRLPLWGLACASMVAGNLAALLQTRIRRMLAYSSVAQMGYVVLALVAGPAGGYRAAAYYAITYGVISLAAFGAITVLERGGCGARLDDYRGLGNRQPFPAAVLALAIFALAGIPPTAGFTGKFLIFTAAVRGGELPLAIIGILTAAVSVYYYLRVVAALYLQSGEPAAPACAARGERLVLGLLCAALLFFGLFPTGLLQHLPW